MNEHWNKCDRCGKFIAFDEFERTAVRRLLTPLSDYTREEYETMCSKCVVIEYGPEPSLREFHENSSHWR